MTTNPNDVPDDRVRRYLWRGVCSRGCAHERCDIVRLAAEVWLVRRRLGDIPAADPSPFKTTDPDEVLDIVRTAAANVNLTDASPELTMRQLRRLSVRVDQLTRIVQQDLDRHPTS
jgi:hypothetical protein